MVVQSLLSQLGDVEEECEYLADAGLDRLGQGLLLSLVVVTRIDHQFDGQRIG